MGPSAPGPPPPAAPPPSPLTPPAATSIVPGETGEQVTTEEAAEARPLASEGVVIEDIRVQVEKGVREKVLIYSRTPFTVRPFALEGEKPRIAIDIPNARPLKRALRSFEVNGEFIKDVRTHHHRDKGTLRVVIDLYPNGNYRVNQSYFEAEHIYMIEVEKE